MKKKIIVGIAGILFIIAIIIAIIAIVIGISINNIKQERAEFIEFKDYIDQEYIPVFDNTMSHLAMYQGTLSTSRQEFADWYEESGSSEKFELQDDLKEAKEKIINKDLEEQDSLVYKKNTLNQIIILEEILEAILYINMDVVTNNPVLSTEELNEKLSELTNNIEEENEIVGEYYF